jgi:hypothetical protein
MRFISFTIAAFALLALFSKGALAAETAKACAGAYYSAAKERGRIQAAGFNNEQTGSLIYLIGNSMDIDYEARGDAMNRRAEQEGNVLGVFGLEDLSQPMMVEGFMARSTYYFSPESVFQTQRQVFERVRACDLQFGFMPPLDPVPSHEAVLAYYKNLDAKEDAAKEARLAALDDQQCTIRFWIAAASAQNNPPVMQAMQERMIKAASAVMAAQPGMTQERLGTIVQREGQERGQKLSGDKQLMTEFGEELNRCEARYDFPLTTVTPQ